MHLNRRCHNWNVQDPWEVQKRAYLRLRDNAEARAREGMDDEEMSKLRTDYDRNSAEGHRTFDVADHTLNREAQKKKQFLSRALKRFQAKTGINEEKYLAMVEEARSPRELSELEKKFRKAGITYYKQQIERSGLFVAMDVREQRFVESEKKMYFDWIEGQPLDAEDEDESSIIEALSHLKEHLEERRKGRKRLEKQSSYVKNEYFRQLGSMAADGSKEKLLDKVLKSIGNMEEEPSAIQAEFKKASKKTEGNKTTEVLLKELKAEYEKRTKAYNKMLAENEHLFGGKEVTTPNGKMRGARAEFEKWYADLHSFAEMDNMMDRLEDTVIPERKKVYEERDEMLAAMPENKRAALRIKTDEMRLHTLKAYLKESKQLNLRESAFAMEYVANLETAEYDGYPLFSSKEKVELKRIIQSSNAELQEAELKVLLGRMIPEREAVTKEYLALDDHLKDDQKFFTGNIYDKRAQVREAKVQKNRELQNPFDIQSLSSLDAEERASLLLTKLGSEQGKRQALDAKRELGQEGKTKRLETQVKIMGVMSGQWKDMRDKGTTQVENYMQKIYQGAKVNNENLWKAAFGDETEAKDDNQKWMAETARTDYRAFLAGRGRTWGGKSVKIGDISKKEFERGDTSMLDKLESALYPENMLFRDAQGDDDLNPAETAADAVEDSMQMELNLLAEKLLGVDIRVLPKDFREALAQLCIVGENSGIFRRINSLRGGTDIVDEVVN